MLDIEALLRQTPPFCELAEAELLACAADAKACWYPRGSYIFRQGEPSREVFFVVASGLVEILLAADSGEEKVVSVRCPPDFFGETVFFSNEAYPASTRAAEDETQCLLVPRARFEKLMATDPRFAGYFSRMLAERMRRLWDGVIREQCALGGQAAERPFRKRLYEIMRTPAVTCAEEAPVSAVARLLIDQRVSSVVVVDASGGPTGIITEKGLVQKVVADGDAEPRRLRARDVLQPHPLTLQPTALFQEALLAMVQHQLKHVIVQDRGRVRGVVTLADLVRVQNVDALSALTGIRHAPDGKALEVSMRQIDRVITGLVDGQATAAETGALVSELYDQVTKRLISLAEGELYAEGRGYAPCGYCWLTMGSGGRREQVIRTDQDNALVYEAPPPGGRTAYQQYFLALGQKVVAGLVALGFAPCPGRVMADNREWCKSYDEWAATLRSWVREPQGDQLRKMTIFFDFRPVYGRFALAAALREAIGRWLGAEPVVLHFLARDALAKKIPLNPLRQVVTEKAGRHKDELDLKRAMLIHFVDGIRLFALREGIEATSTFERLQQLVQHNVFSEDDAEAFRLAYDNMLLMRLRENLKRLSRGQEPSDYVQPRQMNRRELNALREALVVASRLQYLTAAVFRV